MEIEQGQIVRCIVDKISGTSVFVKIDGEDKTGTIILSEIAPGRIRNLRDYVVPKKTIVCKVLRVSQDHIELSLRRVTLKEQKEVLSEYKSEKSYNSMLKTVLKEKTDETISKIKEIGSLYSFLEESKENPKELEKIVGKDAANKIIEILNSQKQKIVTLKKEISLKSTNPKGLILIKEVLKNKKDVEISYLGSGKYSLKAENKDIKKADNQLKEIITEIEKDAKKNNIEFFQK